MLGGGLTEAVLEPRMGTVEAALGPLLGVVVGLLPEGTVGGVVLKGVDPGFTTEHTWSNLGIANHFFSHVSGSVIFV